MIESFQGHDVSYERKISPQHIGFVNFFHRPKRNHSFQFGQGDSKIADKEIGFPKGCRGEF
jgi:hypothetical protein